MSGAEIVGLLVVVVLGGAAVVAWAAVVVGALLFGLVTGIAGGLKRDRTTTLNE